MILGLFNQFFEPFTSNKDQQKNKINNPLIEHFRWRRRRRRCRRRRGKRKKWRSNKRKHLARRRSRRSKRPRKRPTKRRKTKRKSRRTIRKISVKTLKPTKIDEKIAKVQVQKRKTTRQVNKQMIQKAARKMPKSIKPKLVDLSVKKQPLKQLSKPVKSYNGLSFSLKVGKFFMYAILAVLALAGGFFGYFKWIHTGSYQTWMPIAIIGLLKKFGVVHALPVANNDITSANNAAVTEAVEEYNQLMEQQMAKNKAPMEAVQQQKM